MVVIFTVVADVNQIPIEEVVKDKDKLVAMLIDRKLKLNNSNDESKPFCCSDVFFFCIAVYSLGLLAL